MHVVEMTKVICPCCASTEVLSSPQVQAYKALYGPPVDTTIRVDTCQTCHESGDFEGVNDPVIQEAFRQSVMQSISIMAEKLKTEHGYTRVYIERVTGLPFGAISKLERDPPENEADFFATVAVLRMVLTHPPILPMLEAAWRNE